MQPAVSSLTCTRTGMGGRIRRSATRGDAAVDGVRHGAVEDCRTEKLCHAEAAGLMRVFKNRRANSIFAGNGFQAGNGHVETRGLGRLRGKQSKLHLARLTRLRP